MLKPRVSVVIAVYNQERYLAEAIRSVLNQDGVDLELIVVDDGSTDGTAAVAQQFEGVKVLRQENAGQGAAVNNGISNASGEFLAFLDGDDAWEPNMLERQVSRFDVDPSLDMTHGMVLEFVSPELESQGMTSTRVDGKPVAARLGGTTVVRRTALDRVGPMATHIRLGSFLDWIMRAKDAGLNTQLHDDLMLHRRIHRDNLGRRESDSRRDYVKLLKLSLDRRRKL